MSKTLIFCTSYASSENEWTMRYRVWLWAIQASEIAFDHILIVDDGSPVLPNWQNLRITNQLSDDPFSAMVSLYRFDTNLGRQGRSVYPGWFRSFCLASRFAERHGFDRVVHIESDGFVITPNMQRYINAVADDWIAPSILSHSMMPESAIQVMAGSGFRSYVEFCKRPYSEFVGKEAESVLPFTRVERQFVGSRYGETLNVVPPEADFVTQTNPSMRGNPDYYWWLSSDLFF